MQIKNNKQPTGWKIIGFWMPKYKKKVKRVREERERERKVERHIMCK